MATRPFRLHSVARIREMHRDAQRRNFAEALRAEQVLRDQREGLLGEIEQLMQDRRDATSVGPTDTSEVLATQRYELALRSRLALLEGDIGKIEKETEKRRLALVAAEQEVRAMETLKDRSERAERIKREKQETMALDEVASRRAHQQAKEQAR